MKFQIQFQIQVRLSLSNFYFNGEGRPQTITGSRHTIDYILCRRVFYTTKWVLDNLYKIQHFSDHPALFIQLDIDSQTSSNTTSASIKPRRLCYTVKSQWVCSQLKPKKVKELKIDNSRPNSDKLTNL